MHNKCYLIVHQIDDFERYYIPTYPEEVQDSVSVQWADTSIVNRASPIPSFVNTGYRSVSFTITLHREMNSEKDNYSSTYDLEKLIRRIRSCTFPNYNNGNIRVPLVTFVFGQFKVKGIIRNVSVVWKKPIVSDKYSLCDISISIDQPISNSVSATSIMYNRSDNLYGI